MFNRKDIEGLLPLEKIAGVLGVDPKLEYLFGSQIKTRCLDGYNTGVMVKAHRDGKQKVLDDFLHLYFEKDFQFAKKAGLKSPDQVFVQDTLKINSPVVRLHLVDLRPDLYVEHIVLANPYASRPSYPPLPGQVFPGLGNGIFDEILGNIEVYARSKGFDFLSANAAYAPQCKIFQGRGWGFDPNEPEFLQVAMATGESWPIYKEL